MTSDTPSALRKVETGEGCGRCSSEIEDPHVLGVDDNPKGMHYVPLCEDCFDALSEWYDHLSSSGGGDGE